jgi:MFS transporter, SP family, sugar:H+ symporter
VNNGTKGIGNSAAWRIPTGLQLAWGAILAIGMLVLPESPRYLVKRGRDKDAARALARLISSDVDDPAIETELAGEPYPSFINAGN